MTSMICSIGDFVEVMCDHKRGGRRIRDWVEGVVVHADDRMTAIQFRTDVYLTDGWMVPDRILWFNKGSEKIRSPKKTPGHTAPRPAARKPATPTKKKPTVGRKKIVPGKAAKKR
jgi:hypothetical protein